MKENKMKPKRTQRHTGPNWQGKGVSAGEKAPLNHTKPSLRVSSPAQVKPFAGKVFYLDLPSNRIAGTLESDIKELGGTVEKFFSKEINYLVSSKREAKYVQCLRQDSPVPSPDSGQSSPRPRPNLHRPGSHGDNIKGRSQGQTDTFVTSRGKSLVERVVKEQERVQMNKILSNAMEWGVKILYIDDVIASVRKKKDVVSSQHPASTAVKSVKAESAAKQGFQKCNGGRISKPFIKVEDSSRHFRPICLTMPNIPEFNLRTVPPCSPFYVEDKDPPWSKPRGHSEERAHGRKKNRDKKRAGYCECCMIKYENLTMHLRSERHQAFSKSDEYLVVDRLISTLRCNFLQIKTQVKRPKCSVPSVLIAPGPSGETEPRHKGAFNTTEIIKEEQHQTVDGCEGSYSGHTLRLRSVSASPQIHRERDRMKYYTHSDRSKHKSLACKRPRRQNSLTSCAQKPGQAQFPQPMMEAAPSRGECLASILSRVTQVDPVDQITTQAENSSTSNLHNMNGQNEVSSKSLNVLINQQEESGKKHHSSAFEAAQDGKTLPDEITANNLSEKEEVSLLTQNFSPVRKIQRRIRVYKRKRRKVEAHIDCMKPGVFPDSSMMKLWELFQSSDDMDVEFLGFTD